MGANARCVSAGGRLACEELPPDACAFAVSSAGMRCVLECTPEGGHRCQTSAVRGARGMAAAGAGWVETDACVRACGADRAALGLPVASAAAEDRRALRALCSPACQHGCPNVVDLYATLAAGEGACVLPLRSYDRRLSRPAIYVKIIT